jgi:hypothetical protein
MELHGQFGFVTMCTGPHCYDNCEIVWIMGRGRILRLGLVCGRGVAENTICTASPSYLPELFF